MPKKLFYWLLSTLFACIFIYFWSENIEKYVFLPVVKRPYLGILSFILALFLLIWYALNTFLERKKYITIHQFMHYSEAFIMLLGAISLAILSQKASIFWVVLPIIITTIFVFILYMESKKPENRYKVWLQISPNTLDSPTYLQRFFPYLVVFLPWILLYELVIYRGFLPNSIDTYLFFEYEWQVVEWAELFYISAYIYPAFIPFVLKSKADIRFFTISGFFFVAIGIFIQMIFPFVAMPRPFEVQSFWGELLMWERQKDAPVAALPSYHAAWAFLAAYFYERAYPKFSGLFYAWSVAICLSCMAVGVHSLADIIAGIGLVFLVVNYSNIYQYAILFHQKVCKYRLYTALIDRFLHNYFLYLQVILATFLYAFSWLISIDFWQIWLEINLFILLVSLFLLVFTYKNEHTFFWDLLNHIGHIPVILLILMLYFYQIYAPLILGIFFIFKGLLHFLCNHFPKEETQKLHKYLSFQQAKASSLYFLGIVCMLF